MVIAEDLTKLFDNFLAVDGVNLNVQAGEVLVILGPNGAGKTTTVRMLTSILKPSRGRAVVAGYDVVKQPDQVRASVGVLTEQHGLYSRMNAEEYLLFYGQLHGLDKKTCLQRISRSLEEFDLAFARRKRLGEYSKGMRQKLALIRALIHEPPVLLLDEPTSAMDPESARMVRNAIHKLRSNERTIILCTHNLAEAEELANQIAIIHHGRILINDSPNNIKDQVLGAIEYEAVLSHPSDNWIPEGIPGVTLTARGENWMRFHIQNPQDANPLLLHQMLEAKIQVISFQQKRRNLEDAYLKIMSQSVESEQ